MLNITLFSQIISKLDTSKFKKLVKSHQSDKHQKGFDSWSHLVSMLFCQFAKSQSLRGISNGLRSATGNLNHLGMQKTLKNQAKHPWYLSNLVAFIRLNLFVKVDLRKWLDNPFTKQQLPPNKYIQGILF